MERSDLVGRMLSRADRIDESCGGVSSVGSLLREGVRALCGGAPSVSGGAQEAQGEAGRALEEARHLVGLMGPAWLLGVLRGAWAEVLTRADLDEIFTYHAPTEDQRVAYEKLRGDAKMFSLAILELVPAGPDQTSAIRLVRQAVMTANAGIALGGKY